MHIKTRDFKHDIGKRQNIVRRHRFHIEAKLVKRSDRRAFPGRIRGYEFPEGGQEEVRIVGRPGEVTKSRRKWNREVPWGGVRPEVKRLPSITLLWCGCDTIYVELTRGSLIVDVLKGERKLLGEAEKAAKSS